MTDPVLYCRVCRGRMSGRLGSLAVGPTDRYDGHLKWVPSLRLRYCLTCGALAVETVGEQE
jgi:hypothetical protein